MSSSVLLGYKNMRCSQVLLFQKNICAASFLNDFKNIPHKACLLGQIVTWKYSIQEKQAMPYQYSLYKEY